MPGSRPATTDRTVEYDGAGWPVAAHDSATTRWIVATVGRGLVSASRSTSRTRSGSTRRVPRSARGVSPRAPYPPVR